MGRGDHPRASEVSSDLSGHSITGRIELVIALLVMVAASACGVDLSSSRLLAVEVRGVVEHQVLVDAREPVEPTGLGADPSLDALAVRCHAGVWELCDRLYAFSEPGSAYERYGATCADRIDRQPEGCEEHFGAASPPGLDEDVPIGSPPDFTGPPELRAAADDCFAGDWARCDFLARSAVEGTPQHAYGVTCGKRPDAEPPCATFFRDTALP